MQKFLQKSTHVTQAFEKHGQQANNCQKNDDEPWEGDTPRQQKAKAARDHSDGDGACL